ILLSAVLAGASGPAGAGHVSGLAGTGDPFSVDDLVVGEDRGSLLAHHLTDLVEDEADLLLGTLGGAHLDDVAQGAQVRRIDDAGGQTLGGETAHERGHVLLM